MSMTQVEVLRAACCIAGLDGRVCDAEHPLIKRLAEGAGVGAASLNAMITRAERDRNFYEEQFDLLKGEPEETMKTLFRVAVADGDVTQEERIVLRHFAKALGLNEKRFDELLSAAERHVGG